MSIAITKYYKQLALISDVNNSNIESDFQITEDAMIKNKCGTFQLIDDLIRDLVSIKNKLKDRKQVLLNVDASFVSTEDVIKLAADDSIDTTTTTDTVGKPTVWVSTQYRNNVNTDANPTLYENDGTVKFSEAATFEIIRRAAYIIKTLKLGTKANIKAAFITTGTAITNSLNLETS